MEWIGTRDRRRGRNGTAGRLVRDGDLLSRLAVVQRIGEGKTKAIFILPFIPVDLGDRNHIGESPLRAQVPSG